MKVENLETSGFSPNILEEMLIVKREPLVDKGILNFRDPFPPEITEALLAKSLADGHLPGPIDKGLWGEPRMNLWEGLWSLNWALGLLNAEVNPKYAPYVETALRYKRPYLYFIHEGTPIGIFATLENITPEGRGLHHIARELMGNDFLEKVPRDVQVAHIDGKTTEITDGFLNANSIHYIRETTGVVLDGEEKEELIAMPEGELQKKLAEIEKRKHKVPSDPTKAYLEYLLLKGAKKHKMEWGNPPIEKTVKFLKNEYLPSVVEQKQTLTIAFSVPND